MTYDCVSFLADILGKVIGKSEHHILHTEAFVNPVKDLKVEPDEILISYDVSAIFTSIPVDSALEAVKIALEKDDSWKEITDLTADQVLQLLVFCVRTTYFVFREQFYLQCGGCTMGSPVSPVIANLYREHFEKAALSTSPVANKIWIRYVDDKFVIIPKSGVDEFFEHINSQNAHIKFTSGQEEDGHLAFLDTGISHNPDGSLDISMYRKSPHTDQYLHFDLHYPVGHKLSVIRTLVHRADIAVTNPQEREKEVKHIHTALGRCGYRKWAFDLAKGKKTQSKHPNKIFVTLPFVDGLWIVFPSYTKF